MIKFYPKTYEFVNGDISLSAIAQNKLIESDINHTDLTQRELAFIDDRLIEYLRNLYNETNPQKHTLFGTMR